MAIDADQVAHFLQHWTVRWVVMVDPLGFQIRLRTWFRNRNAALNNPKIAKKK